MNKIDRAGKRYGRVIALRETRIGNHVAWLCRCDCGAEGVIISTNMGRRGVNCSCGVESRANKRGWHRMAGTRTFFAWHNAKTRCYNKKNSRYNRYGGRGIAMCRRWRTSFKAFLSDMGVCPEGMTLERIETDGNYEPGNCRWATKLEQARNKSNSLKVVRPDGSVTTIKQIAEERGISYYTLRVAAKRGEDPLSFIPRGY